MDDGLLLNLKLKCKTPYSTQSEAETSDFDFFEIDFKSECRDAIISKPTTQFS